MSIFAIESPPLLVPGCILWLDAADASTITQSANAVSAWNDKSGNRNHATSSGSAKPTTNSLTLSGLNVMSFNGSTQYMAAPSINFPANSLTIYAVAKGSSGGSYKYILAIAADKHLFFGQLGSNFATFFGDGANWNNVAANTPSTDISTGYKLLRCVQNGNNNPAVSRTALTVKSGDAMAAFNLGLYIGATFTPNQFWSGGIAEIIIYKIPHSAAQINIVENYLVNKWGGI